MGQYHRVLGPGQAQDRITVSVTSSSHKWPDLPAAPTAPAHPCRCNIASSATGILQTSRRQCRMPYAILTVIVNAILALRARFHGVREEAYVHGGVVAGGDAQHAHHHSAAQLVAAPADARGQQQGAARHKARSEY